MSRLLFFSFESSYPGTILVPATAMQHGAAALSRLLEQWKNKPNIAALLAALVAPSQALENALQQLYVYRRISTATGAQLDLLGSLVGQLRNGLGDTDYARYIAARVSTNSSGGTVQDLITVTKLLLNDATLITVMPQAIAALLVQLTGTAISDTVAGIVISFLRDARAAGVKLSLESSPDVDAATFACVLCCFQTTSLAIGDVTVPVDSTTGFLSSGSIVVGFGTINFETVTYTAITATAFLNCSPMTKTHASGLQVNAGSGATATMLGFGDSGDVGQPTLVAYTNVGVTGGRLIDVRE